MQTNLIFIIGYMGVGKTTLGKSLAKQLNYTFIDLDQVIESKFEITINSFFEQYGETAFRDEETKVLKDVINLQNQAVVAEEGGCLVLMKT